MIKTILAFFIIIHFLGAEPKVIGTSRIDSNDPVGGTVLVSEMGCLNCHASEYQTMSKQGPQLNLLGNRVRADWVRKFLKDPQKLKPGTSMPNLFHGGAEDEQNIEALTHYLLSDRKPESKMPKIHRTNQRLQGKNVYHKVGCVNCHGPNPITKATASKHFLGLGAIKEKYSMVSLTRFLEKPLEHRPSGRMPDFQLGAEDASHIAAYLLNRKEMNLKYNPRNIEPLSIDPKLAAQGKQVFEKMGCANCHTKKGSQSKLVAPAWESLDMTSKHCLDSKGKIRYNLKPQQKRSIQTAKLNLLADSGHQLKHTLISLNCYACHQRDQVGGPLAELDSFFHGEESLGDEGRFPPHLSGVGRKLKLDYLTKLFKGKGGVREHLQTKMPVFGKSIMKDLPKLFEKQDLPKSEKGQVDLKGGDAKVGQHLLGSKALSCIMCHGFKDRPSTGIPALNIAFAPDRLRPAWFVDNLIHPAKIRTGTLMPSFWPNGNSTQPHILKGDTQLQIASIWEYLKTSKGFPEGYPPPRKKFELFPQEQPIVYRTFMNHIGTHAIAVGDSSGLNFAYNSEKNYLAILWKGRFLDTYNKKINRFADFDEPLGDSVSYLEPHSVLIPKPDVSLSKKSPAELGFVFEGYRLSTKGRPVFLMSYLGCRIEETFEPLSHGEGFKRTLKIDGDLPELYFVPMDLKGWNMTKKPQLDDKQEFTRLNQQSTSIILEMEYKS